MTIFLLPLTLRQGQLYGAVWGHPPNPAALSKQRGGSLCSAPPLQQGWRGKPWLHPIPLSKGWGRYGAQIPLPSPQPTWRPCGAGDGRLGRGEGPVRGRGPENPRGSTPARAGPRGPPWPNTLSPTRGGVGEYCALQFLPWEVLVPPSLFWRPLGGLARFGTTIHNPRVPPRLPALSSIWLTSR